MRVRCSDRDTFRPSLGSFLYLTNKLINKLTNDLTNNLTGSTRKSTYKSTYVIAQRDRELLQTVQCAVSVHITNDMAQAYNH